jgi:Holin of 3TMs, for gene-transfer release
MGMDLTGLGSVFDFGSKVIDKIWPDPAQRDAAKLELFKAQQAGEFKEMDQVFQLAQAQIGVNTEEAKSPSVFTSGWRPYIGWICGTGLAYQFLIYPVLIAYIPKIVQLDMGTLLTLLLGMLGLGAMRTTEKIKGVV